MSFIFNHFQKIYFSKKSTFWFQITKILEITKCLQNISLRAFGRSGYCDHQRRRCCCRCRWRHTFVPRQNLRTAIGIDLLFLKWLVWIRSHAQSKKLGLLLGKALGKFDFLRFFNKKFNNFRTKLDMDLHFF